MAIFRPTTPATVIKISSVGTDLYGQPANLTSISTFVQVVKFLDNSTQTPLRQEMSASHGRLDSEVAAAVLMFAPDFNIQIDDIVEVFGITLVVDGVWPRQNTLGTVVHQRVQLHRKVL